MSSDFEKSLSDMVDGLSDAMLDSAARVTGAKIASDIIEIIDKELVLPDEKMRTHIIYESAIEKLQEHLETLKKEIQVSE